MVNIAGSYDQNAQPGGDFDPIPAGKYIAEIVESSIEDISKNRNLGSCLLLQWKITQGDYQGRLLFHRINMFAENMNNNSKVVQIAETQFASVRMATGVQMPQDTEELHHRPCELTVAYVPERTDPATGRSFNASNEVKNVKPLGGAPQAAQGGPVPAPQQQASTAPAPRQQAAPQRQAAGASRPWN